MRAARFRTCVRIITERPAGSGWFHRREVDVKVLIVAFSLAGILSAQETVNSASVGGRVTDPSGAVVETARVTARQNETNITSATITDREGRFRFPYLRPGPYEIKVAHPGFAEMKREVVLSVGSAFELPFSLAVAAEATTVNVNGAQPDRRHGAAKRSA
jgi:hypothetical protein